MRLEGSCYCRAITFSLESHTPYPFNRCYCSICRKTAGGGGYAINIMGLTDSFSFEGSQHIKRFQATVDGEKSPAVRSFCGKCGSALWLYDERWPDWIYPLASAIDSELPAPPDKVYLMLESKPRWVELRPGDSDRQFPLYPEEGIEEWHEKRGLLVD